MADKLAAKNDPSGFVMQAHIARDATPPKFALALTLYPYHAKAHILSLIVKDIIKQRI